MASVETSTTRTASGKTAPESGYTVAPPVHAPNLFAVDFSLRLLLFASALSALVVLITSKQTEMVPTSLPPPFPALVSRPADYKHSPAFIYLLAALALTCLYSLITIMTSSFAMAKPSPSAKMMFHLILLDAVMAGIVASATGASAAVAYIGLKGNSHVRWLKICNVYGKFCRHIGSSTAVSLVASIILVVLVVVQSYSLYRRSR